MRADSLFAELPNGNAARQHTPSAGRCRMILPRRPSECVSELRHHIAARSVCSATRRYVVGPPISDAVGRSAATICPARWQPSSGRESHALRCHNPAGSPCPSSPVPASARMKSNLPLGQAAWVRSTRHDPLRNDVGPAGVRATSRCASGSVVDPSIGWDQALLTTSMEWRRNRGRLRSRQNRASFGEPSR